jgi:hypothetical protein
MNDKRSQVTTSLFSVILSFIASSHHWLHMGILLLLGGSTNMMSMMSGVVWIRRFMIIATLFTVCFSIYKLKKHRCREISIISLTAFSVLLSLGFISYTLIDFGW